MIRYVLKCVDGHDFESWFRSAEAYDTLRATGGVTCPICGEVRVEKALMAPAVRTPEPRAAAVPDVPAALAAMRRHIEANTDDVGRDFAREARAIHEGDAPERAIRGEAQAHEARALLEDGIPVLPLPFLPPRRVN